MASLADLLVLSPTHISSSHPHAHPPCALTFCRDVPLQLQRCHVPDNCHLLSSCCVVAAGRRRRTTPHRTAHTHTSTQRTHHHTTPDHTTPLTGHRRPRSAHTDSHTRTHSHTRTMSKQPGTRSSPRKGSAAAAGTMSEQTMEEAVAAVSFLLHYVRSLTFCCSADNCLFV